MAISYIPRLFKNLDATGSGSGGGGVLTLSNGLTLNGTDGELGGFLTKDTTIDGTFNFNIGSITPLSNISFSTDNGSDSSSFNLDPTEVDLYYSSSGISFTSLSLDISRANLYWSDVIGDSKQINVDVLGIGIDTISSGSYFSYLKNDNTTNNRTFQFPDVDGTFALTADLAYYLPLTLNTSPTSVQMGVNALWFYKGLIRTVDFNDGIFSDNLGVESIDYINRFFKNSSGVNNIQYGSTSGVRINTNLGLNGASYGSGTGVVFIANATVDTSANPTGGAIIQAKSDSLFARLGTGGLDCFSGKTITDPDNYPQVVGVTRMIYTGTGGHTFDLHTAVGYSSEITIKNFGSGNLTVDAFSTQTIDGALTLTVLPGECYKLLSDGANWYITSKF